MQSLIMTVSIYSQLRRVLNQGKFESMSVLGGGVEDFLKNFNLACCHNYFAYAVHDIWRDDEGKLIDSIINCNVIFINVFHYYWGRKLRLWLYGYM